MTISLAAMILLTCILQISSLGSQTIQIFSKSLERPSPPIPAYVIDYSPYSEWRTRAWDRSGGSNRSTGGSGMDPEQYQT